MATGELCIGCGTYDGSVFVLGHLPDHPAQLRSLLQVRGAHSSSVRSVAIKGSGIVASGGTDDYIQLFSVQTTAGKKPKGELLDVLELFSGQVNHITFHGDGLHMFSCSSDKSLTIWRQRSGGKDWETIRRLTRHKEAVLGFAVHPTGRMALSVSTDKTLRTWNLMYGRQAFVVRLKEAARDVVFSPTAQRYLIAFEHRVEVYRVDGASLECAIDLEQRTINDVVFFTDDKLLLAVNNSVQLYQLSSGDAAVTPLGDVEVSGGRVKAIRVVMAAGDSRLVVVASTGRDESVVEAYRVPDEVDRLVLDAENRVLRHAEENRRITCMDVCWLTGQALETDEASSSASK